MNKNTVPKHIAFIMDGNRRFARNEKIPEWKGHEAGADNLKNVLEACRDLGVKEVSLYTFSMQNFNRSEEEKNHIFRIISNGADRLLSEKDFISNEHGVMIRFAGRTHLLPEKVQEKLRKIEEQTRNNSERIVNVCIAYGGREEIVDAVRKIADQVKEGDVSPEDIDEDMISGELYFSSEPDIIIRTGAVTRTSNFLMWQSIYSEWFFLDKMWPELAKEDIIDCIEEFNNRERRFGK